MSTTRTKRAYQRKTKSAAAAPHDAGIGGIAGDPEPTPRAPTADERKATVAAATPQRAPEPDEPLEPVLTRRSRTVAGGDNDFEIPAKFKKPGMDYEWMTTKVMGEEVDDADLASYHEQGWRPARPTDMPGFCAPGYEGKTIDRRGQRLFFRPMHLSAQAKHEDYVIAETQKRDKLAASSAVAIPSEGRGKMHSVTQTLEISGEVGTHRPAA